MLNLWLNAELPSSEAVRWQYFDRGSLDMRLSMDYSDVSAQIRPHVGLFCFLQIASVPLCELRDLRRGVAAVGYLNRTFRAFRLQLSSANDAAFE